jgi:hypothetical protein
MLRVEFDPQSQQRVNELVRDMIALTGREKKIVVRNLGRDFLRKAYYLTPRAVKNTGYMVQTEYMPKYLAFSRQKQGKLKIVGLGGRMAKVTPPQRVRPKGIGYAKAGWFAAMDGVGLAVPAGGSKYRGKGAASAGIFDDGGGRDDYWIEVGNGVPFIEELDTQHMITQRATDDLLARMGGRVQALQDKWVREWTRV